ncbi:MAG: DUF2007 domain-containing protein [Chloroflexi bacterium]|nr:DUF2007 domain-containing protein [Chloroflexota bacterium]
MNRRVKADDPFVVVYVAQGMLIAEMIKSKLESAGIPAMLKYESVGRVLGLTIDGLGEVRVLVARENENDARALLEKNVET